MDDITPEIIDALKRLHQIIPARWLIELPRAIECVQTDTRYGTVELVIVDGRIVGIDKSTKAR